MEQILEINSEEKEDHLHSDPVGSLLAESVGPDGAVLGPGRRAQRRRSVRRQRVRIEEHLALVVEAALLVDDAGNDHPVDHRSL